jgi:dienelactone hydrolase
MLRAARGYLATQGRTLRSGVMVTGFSPGAPAALGLARALQRGGGYGFRLGALAPVGGAYDLRHAELPALLDGELARLNPDHRLGAQFAGT